MARENLAGENGVLTPLIQRFLQKAMEAEMSLHIAESKAEGNRRNGHGRKQVKTDLGEVSITPPRDRQGSFAPEILPKRQPPLTGT